jgi:hypothetical protein
MCQTAAGGASAEAATGEGSRRRMRARADEEQGAAERGMAVGALGEEPRVS